MSFLYWKCKLTNAFPHWGDAAGTYSAAHDIVHTVVLNIVRLVPSLSQCCNGYLWLGTNTQLTKLMTS